MVEWWWNWKSVGGSSQGNPQNMQKQLVLNSIFCLTFSWVIIFRNTLYSTNCEVTHNFLDSIPRKERKNPLRFLTASHQSSWEREKRNPGHPRSQRECSLPGGRFYTGTPQKIPTQIKLPKKILAKFSYPKKSRNRKFQAQKNPLIIPSLEIPSTPPGVTSLFTDSRCNISLTVNSMLNTAGLIFCLPVILNISVPISRWLLIEHHQGWKKDKQT